MNQTQLNRSPPSLERERPIATSIPAPPLWPPKFNVCSVLISATDYDEVVDCLMAAALRRESAVASFFAVHAVVTAGSDPELLKHVNQFEIVAPDGQPVRWALGWLHSRKLRDRVYGPETTLRLCRRAAELGVPVYLYGGANEDVLSKLKANLLKMFPTLQFAGSESPPFRKLTIQEDAELIERIHASGAGLTLIGLGCPKQDQLAARLRGRLNGAIACVGAAFDFHAGVKTTAPRWMQRNGLEWLYRLCQEPRRLFGRYMVTNTVFLQRLSRAWLFRQS